MSNHVPLIKINPIKKCFLKNKKISRPHWYFKWIVYEIFKRKHNYLSKKKQKIESSFPPKAETNPTMASQLCLQDGVETRGKRGGKDLEIHSWLPQQQLWEE